MYLSLIAVVKVNPCDLLTWLTKIAASVSLCIAFLQPLTGLTEELNAVSADSAASAPSPPVDIPNTMDTRRNYMSGKLEKWAKNIDSFFGDYRNYQESNDSVIQLYVSQLA